MMTGLNILVQRVTSIIEIVKNPRKTTAQIAALVWTEMVSTMAEHEREMYVLYHGETPVAYRYGEPWVSQQLLMEGGYDTPEEAKRAWEDDANNG